MNSELRKVFGTALLFALAFGTISVERGVTQTLPPLELEDCSEGNVIIVTTDTHKTVYRAEETAREVNEDATTRPRTIQELIDCAGPGDTIQFADGVYEDVGVLTFKTNGDDPATTDVENVEFITVRGNPRNPAAVMFVESVEFRVIATHILIDGLAFEETREASEEGGPSGTHTVRIDTWDADNLNTADPETSQCVGKSIAVGNSVFRNTSGDGIRVEESLNPDCLPDGFEIAGNTFADIGYNRDWVDGMGPRELGTGIPTIGSLSAGNLNGEPGHNFSAVRFLGSSGSTGFRNVSVIDNTVDGTTYAGIVVQGATGDGDTDTLDAIEISYNSVSNVPSFGIRVQELPTAEVRDYDLVIRGNRVTNANNSAWTVTNYEGYSNADYLAAVRTVAELTLDRQIDWLLKPEIWSVSEGITSKIFGSDGAPVNVYENFGGVLDNQDPPQPAPTDGRVAEYNDEGMRKLATDSPIPQAGGGSCPADGDCLSVVRSLDPRAEGAIELDSITTESVTITENELTGNTLGLVVCGGQNCYFDRPYRAVNSLTYGPNQATYAGAHEGTGIGFDISMNNIYDNRATEEEEDVPGESAIGVGELDNLPRRFAIGDVYVSIGPLDDKVDLDGNYLGADPVLITDPEAESLERSGAAYELAAERFDIDVGPRESAAPPMLMSATVDVEALTLTYSEDLDEASVPAAGDFTMAVGEEERGVSEVSVTGRNVTLTLASAVMARDMVRLSYIPGDNPIRDGDDGLPAAAIIDVEVTNNTKEILPPLVEDDDDSSPPGRRNPRGPETIPITPMLISATVDRSDLTLTYRGNLDENSVPSADAFTVTVEGEVRGVSEVAVGGSSVTLMLETAVEEGDKVTVSYEVPERNPIRGKDGGEAAAISDMTVVKDDIETPEPPGSPIMKNDGGGGCALASRRSGVNLGMLLALVAMPFGLSANKRRRGVS